MQDIINWKENQLIKNYQCKIRVYFSFEVGEQKNGFHMRN